MSAKARAYLELLRVHNLAVSVVTTAIGYVAARGGFGWGLVWAALAVVLVAAGGYVINDYYDIDTDSIVKPWRPIPSGRVSRREARALAYLLLALGVAAAAPLGPEALVFAAVNAISVHEYSRWVKRTGFAGNVVVALNSAATIVMGGLASPHEPGSAVFIAALIAFLLVLGREIVKGIEDYEGDREACYMTLAVILTPTRAARVAALLLAMVAVVSPIPLLSGYGLAYAFLALATDIIVVHAVYTLLRAASCCPIHVAPKLRRSLKIAFALGGLAFLLGAPGTPT